MKYLPQVVSAHYVKEFIVFAKFDDGTEKNIDISQWFKGPVFEPLKNQKAFKKFFVEGGTLAWPSGVDIAPEALYMAEDALPEKAKKTEPKRRRPVR